MFYILHFIHHQALDNNLKISWGGRRWAVWQEINSLQVMPRRKEKMKIVSIKNIIGGGPHVDPFFSQKIHT